MSEQQKANNGLMNVANFVKTVAKNAPALALTAAVVPDIMDFMKGLTDPFYETGEALEELGLTASEGFEEMATDIADSIYRLQPVAENLGIWIGDTYDDIQEKDWEGLRDDIDTGLSSAWDGVVSFFESPTLAEDFGKGAAAVVMGITDFMGGITQEEWNNIFSGIETGLKTFIDNIDYGSTYNSISTFFEELIQAILEFVIRTGEDSEDGTITPIDPGEWQ